MAEMKADATGPQGHARLSASQTSHWWGCPGGAATLELRPDLRRESGPAAALGTAAHAVLERCLKEGKEPEYFRDRIVVMVGEGTSILKKNAKPPKDPTKKWFEVDDDMVAAVRCATDYVRRRLAEEDGAELTTEGHTVPLPERDDTGGTSDVTIDCWPDLYERVDYKHGSGVFVPVEGNKQLLSYLLGGAEETGWSHELYRMTIIQPRHHLAPHDGVMSVDVTREELMEFRDGLREAAGRVDRARAMLAKGDLGLQELYEDGLVDKGDHCTFCDLKAGCPAKVRAAVEEAQADFDAEPPAGKAPKVEVAWMEDDRLCRAALWAPYLKSWAKSVEDETKRRMHGKDLPGLKFVRGPGSRAWAEGVTPDDVRGVLEQAGVDPELATPRTLVTPPAAEKLLSKEDRGLLEQLIERREGGLLVAPETDRRPAVVVDRDAEAASDFEED